MASPERGPRQKYFPEISYFNSSPYGDDFEENLKAQIAEVDTLLEDLFKTAETGQVDQLKIRRAEWGQKILNLKLYLTSSPLVEEVKKDLAQALEVASQYIDQTLVFVLKRAQKPPQGPIARELFHRGIWSRHIEKSWIDEIGGVIKEKYYQKLNQQFHPSNRLNVVSFRESSAEFQEIRKKVDELGLISAAQEFFGYPVKIFYIAAILNRQGENWYLPVKENDPLQHFHYLHFDGDPNVMKVIIYLQDVSPEEGPFKFIRRDSFSFRKDFGYFIALANDYVFRPKFENENESRYYRKIFLPPYYDYFRSLPRVFQRLSHFGDDIEDQTSLAQTFKNAETVLDSKTANVFAFDGSSLLHRGGQVQKGERLAVQVAFMPLMNGKEVREHYVHLFKSRIVDFLRYVGLKKS